MLGWNCATPHQRSRVLKDFAPVTMLASMPFAPAVNPNVPASQQRLGAEAKAGSPQDLPHSSPRKHGNGEQW